MALAEVAAGTILDLGAVDYKNFDSSYFASKEVDILHEGI
jgi:hypothetical protein